MPQISFSLTNDAGQTITNQITFPNGVLQRIIGAVQSKADDKKFRDSGGTDSRPATKTEVLSFILQRWIDDLKDEVLIFEQNSAASSARVAVQKFTTT